MMNEVPFRITSQQFPWKILVGLIMAAVAGLVLISSLPFWLRIWLWAPIVGIPLALMFGRFHGRPLFDVVVSWLAFIRRWRLYVWRTRRTDVDERIAFEPAVIRRFARHPMTLGLASLGLVIAFLIDVDWHSDWHSMERTSTMTPALSTLTPFSTLAPPSLSDSSGSIRVLASLTSQHQISTSVSPASTIIATPVVENPFSFSRTVMAFPGTLIVRRRDQQSSCHIVIEAPGANWTSVFWLLPGDDEANLFITPLLQPQIAGRGCTLYATCALDVKSVPFAPRQPMRARIWLLPLCTPPGRVHIKTYESGGPFSVTLLDPEGEVLAAMTSSPSGEIEIPSPPDGCWLYRLEAATSVWLEVLVIQ